MKVYLLTAYPEGARQPTNFQAQWLRNSARRDPFGKHELAESPEAADLVLFIENHPDDDPLFLRVATHPVWRRFARKAFLYHDSDYAYPFAPGLYPSLTRRHHSPERCGGCHYIGRIEENKALRFAPLGERPEYLFSFVGGNNHPVRARLLGLKHPRAFVQDTTGQHAWLLSHTERQAYEQHYNDVLAQSAFVLCPAGLGPSTYRLFETMECGRVPVILSDSWVAPAGVPWETCSLRVPEAAAESIPEMLASVPPERVLEMAANARRVWQSWFSQDVSFHRIVSWCEAIVHERSSQRSLTNVGHVARLLGSDPRMMLRFLRRTRWRAAA